MRNKIFAASSLAMAITLAGCSDDETTNITNTTNADSAGFSVIANVLTTAANDFTGLTYGADGSIYVSGHVDGADAQVIVAKYTSNGILDTDFGTNGIVTIDIAPGADEDSSAIVQMSDGDVVVSAQADDADGDSSVYLLRFDGDTGAQRLVGDGWGDANGLVEVVFSDDNATNPDADDDQMDLLVDSADRLIVFADGTAPGSDDTSTRDRYITRLSGTDGSFDATFNGGAPFRLDVTTADLVTSFDDNSRRGLILSDDSILSSGYTNIGSASGDTAGSDHHVIVVKLTSAGIPDASFGGTIAPASTDTLFDPITGATFFNPYNPDRGFAEAYAVGELSDGDIVINGYGAATERNAGGTSSFGYRSSEAQDFVAFGLPANGTAVDTDFGNDGNLAVQSEGLSLSSREDRGRDLVVLGDDRQVHVGRFGGTAAAFVLTADGQLDTTVGGDGIIELPNATVGQQFFNVDLSPNGAQLAMTTSADSAGARLVILSIN